MTFSCLNSHRNIFNCGEVDGDPSSVMVRVVIYANRSVVSVSDTPANREPETRTTGLCGDKGVENLSEDVLRNSTAGVAHLRQQRGGPCAFSPGQSGC